MGYCLCIFKIYHDQLEVTDIWRHLYIDTYVGLSQYFEIDIRIYKISMFNVQIQFCLNVGIKIPIQYSTHLVENILIVYNGPAVINNFYLTQKLSNVVLSMIVQLLWQTKVLHTCGTKHFPTTASFTYIVTPQFLSIIFSYTCVLYDQ